MDGVNCSRHRHDGSASGARHRSDRPGWARRHRPTPRRGRAGPRPHASLRGGGDAAGERRSRHRRPHRARIARRRTARCRCRLPRLDRPAGDCSGSCRASRNPRAACRLPLGAAQRPRTRSSSNRIRWRCSTPISSGSSRPPGSSRRSSGRGCSRRTRCSGGRPRSAPTVSSGGRTALPRRHPSMTATWQPSRRGPCIRTDMLEATTSSRAPSH